MPHDTSSTQHGFVSKQLLKRSTRACRNCVDTHLLLPRQTTATLALDTFYSNVRLLLLLLHDDHLLLNEDRNKGVVKSEYPFHILVFDVPAPLEVHNRDCARQPWTSFLH